MQRLLCLLLLPLSAMLTAASPSAAVVRAAEDFSRVAERVGPWVVNIGTTQYVKQRLGSFWQDFYGFDPYGGGTRTFKRQSLGSGFIYSSDGQILTNAHVVAGADEIMVRLQDGTEASATVIGEDASVDLALLKIDVNKPLPAAVLGDSAAVRVGEWAIAIGNPMGFDHTLTVGVISAKERTNIFSGQGAARYQNYLQTDASINHGNSGGPLCNIKGELIGMNTAISTPNDGSVGIGFAIPVNFIKRSVPDLQRSGRVVAPRLGFFTQDVDARLATVLKLPVKTGVLITDVVSGGAAEKAGLKRGDVLLSVNAKAVANTAELRTRIYEADPAAALTLGVWRDGKRLGLQVAPAQLQAPVGAWHGLTVEGNSRSLAAARGLALPEGVIVTAVAKGSSADRIGIKPGDVLLELNQQRLVGLEDWVRLSSRLDPGQQAVVLLLRGRQSAYVVLPGEE
jgi:S1-C subfamily serine protease